MVLDANLRVLGEGDAASAGTWRSTPATSAPLTQGDLGAPCGVLLGEVAAIERALFEDAASTRDGGPPREPLGGTAEMLHRHTAAVMFGQRGGGKSTVALVLAVSAAAHGERALCLDWENGPGLTRQRVQDILAAHPDWPDVLADGRFVGVHGPALSASWSPDAWAAVAHQHDFTLVVIDSLRAAQSRLEHDPDATRDTSKFFELLVDPLVRDGRSVLLLDNVGHQDQHRPRNSSVKLDIAQLGYEVKCQQPFSPARLGRITVECTRSRYGDIGRDWTLRVGDGVFDLPTSSEPSPEHKAASRARNQREEVRRAAIAALQEEAPCSLRALVVEIRQRGVKARNERLRELLGELAADPISGITHSPDGFALAACPEQPGTPGHTGHGLRDGACPQRPLPEGEGARGTPPSPHATRPAANHKPADPRDTTPTNPADATPPTPTPPHPLTGPLPPTPVAPCDRHDHYWRPLGSDAHWTCFTCHPPPDRVHYRKNTRQQLTLNTLRTRDHLPRADAESESV